MDFIHIHTPPVKRNSEGIASRVRAPRFAGSFKPKGGMAKVDSVWVFNGGGDYPAGVFSTRVRAEAWLARHKLTGVLTRYPLDIGLYEWSIDSGVFKPQRPDQLEPRFIGRFNSASLEHYHYESGIESGT